MKTKEKMLGIFCIVQPNVNSHHIIMPFLNHFLGIAIEEKYNTLGIALEGPRAMTQGNAVEELSAMKTGELWLKSQDHRYWEDCG